MSSLPFPVTLRLPASASTGSVRVVLLPEPEDADDLSGASLAGAASLLALFAQAVNAQMFTRATGMPARWTELSPLTAGPQGAHELQAGVENLPLAAWAHLLALLRKNHDALEPLRAVLIEAAGVADPQTLQSVLDAVPKRLRDDDPGFDWSTPGVDKSKNLHLDLAFIDEVQPEVLARVEEALSAWLQLNILGAFDLEFEEADDLDPLGTIKSTSAYRIECWVPFFTGDISGLVALENLLYAVHRDGQAIDEAILE
jgi:hypothetical protein